MDYKKILSVCWFGVCYHKEQLDALIHSQDVKYYAYILHDKDVMPDGKPKKPHYHFLVQLSRNQRGSWFKRFNTDDMGMIFPEPVHDAESAYNYLIHDTPTSRKDGKHLYNTSERISTFESFSIEEKEDENTALYTDIAALIKGELTWHEMLKRSPKRIHMIANIRCAYNLLRDESYGVLDEEFNKKIEQLKQGKQ